MSLLLPGAGRGSASGGRTDHFSWRRMRHRAVHATWGSTSRVVDVSGSTCVVGVSRVFAGDC
eukprot:6796312-Pyramimonas_sp.AAC.1